MIKLNIQWHITTNCSNRCKHCYMYDELTYQDEKNNTLSLKNLIAILDNISNFEKKYNVEFHKFYITGGDPLMREDWHEFLLELKKRNKTISLMGNPETLSNKNLSLLADLGIESFQMSLDGLEKTHDYFRSKGSFQRTIGKIEELKAHNIKTNIMFTLYPTNAQELIPLIRFVAENTKTDTFGFDIGCFVGCGSKLERNFSQHEIQKILGEYIKEKNRLNEISPLRLAEKSNLLKLSRFENNVLYPINPLNTPVVSGCLVGWTPPSILSDGTCLACRRMPLKVGKLPEDSFEEILLGNELLKKFRRAEFFKGCNSCELYSICRGCPANVHSLTNDPFEKNPLCFRENINRKIYTTPRFPSPTLNNTYQEEFDFFASHYIFFQDYYKYFENIEFSALFLDFCQDDDKRTSFLKDPFDFIKESSFLLSHDEIAWLMYYFSEKVTTRQNHNDNPLAHLASINILKQALPT